MLDDGSVLRWIVERSAPPGGAVVMLAEVYMDESGTHDRSPMLAVAGYLFERNQAHRFSRDWQRCLNSIPLTCAHQTDCANGRGEYADLSMEQRLRSTMLLIENIKRRTRFGFCATVDPALYQKILGSSPDAPSAYAFLLQGCLLMVSRWIKRNTFTGSVSYFFEAGHASQSEAARYIHSALIAEDQWKELHRYAGHAFVEKKHALPLQAADFLAWQVHHYYKRMIVDGHARQRLDFAAIMRPQDRNILYSEDDLKKFKELVIDAGLLSEWRSGRAA